MREEAALAVAFSIMALRDVSDPYSCVHASSHRAEGALKGTCSKAIPPGKVILHEDTVRSLFDRAGRWLGGTWPEHEDSAGCGLENEPPKLRACRALTCGTVGVRGVDLP